MCPRPKHWFPDCKGAVHKDKVRHPSACSCSFLDLAAWSCNISRLSLQPCQPFMRSMACHFMCNSTFAALLCSQSVPSGPEAQEHPCQLRLQAQSLRLWAGTTLLQRHAHHHLLDRLCCHTMVPGARAVRLLFRQVLTRHRHLEHRLHLCRDPAGQATLPGPQCCAPAGAHH